MENPKPSAVFDTGIFLQATISKSGPSGRLLTIFDEDGLTLYHSLELLDEIRDVLTRPILRRKNPHYTDEDIEKLLNRLEQKSVLVPDIPEHFHYARDPDDEFIINLAIEAKAQYLVARDRDLLELMTNSEFRDLYPGLTIIDPVAFLRELANLRVQA